MATDSERVEKGQLLCRIIIEILGAPKEHVEETLRGYVAQIKQSELYSIVEAELAPAEPKDEMFSAFAELTLWMKNTSTLMAFCFDFMPSSIEIVKPGKLLFDSSQFAGYLNDLQARLHHTDMLLKTLTAQDTVLNKNAKALLKNLVTLSLRRGAQTMDELSLDCGISKSHLDKFMNHFIKEGYIGKKEDKYFLNNATGSQEQG
ncbi:MAG: hypothetical protein V1735_02100 [Nanoarchaeota archaeon]